MTLIEATLAGDFDEASTILAQGNDINSTFGECRWSALHYAAEHRQLKVAIWLLENGADPNLRDFAGQTPLFIAIDSDADAAHDRLVRTGVLSYDTEVLSELLNRGGDPNAKRSDGLSLLQLAIRRKHGPAEELLRSFGART